MKLSDDSFDRFCWIFSVASGRLRWPAALAASTPRNASVGRIGQSRLIDSSFASTRSLMNLPAACFTSTRSLPEQMPSICFGVTPRSSPFRKMRAPGGSEVSFSEASDSSSRTGSYS